MADHRLYDRFVSRLGEDVKAEDKDFVNALLSEAEDTVLDITGRNSVPAQLDSLVVKISVSAYNKRGAEGESSRSEGGISRAFEELPEDDKARLRNYPRKVGAIHAADES
ncbi:MAG: phage head-tail connector protein [Ruminiclostridium sp.]|nr:phage head-tail connector protein [Ruminiclostridium sp.]MBP3856524.1 phage head-tail connector protein [Ruminiclostridium sp.]